MRLPLRVASGTLVFALVVLSSMVFAQEQYTLTPSLSVSEIFDDNIFLEPSGFEDSDYITAITPGLLLDVQTQRHMLQVSYAPSFVMYSRNTENDTVRHTGTVTYHQDVSRNWRFDFTDAYRKSEDPLEDTPGIETVRRTRNPYQRNEGEARVSYLFGPENIVTAGYLNSLLINEDPTVDDGTIHEPFANFTYWFDRKHGMGGSLRYTIATFTSDDNSLAQPDYTGHSPEVRYLHRFDPQTSGYVSYMYTTRDFDAGFRRDYDVHTIMASVDKQFSPETGATVGLGYFSQAEDGGEDDGGISYNLYLRKTYQRSRFLIGGAGGWDEQYLESENRGFVEYRSVEANGEYTFLEPLSGYAAAVYRQDMYQDDLEQDTWRGSAGLRWAFHRYVSVRLDYTHVSRTSDNPADEYDDNRYMIILTGSKPYRWQ